jgi:hypothetical protein
MDVTPSRSHRTSADVAAAEGGQTRAAERDSHPGEPDQWRGREVCSAPAGVPTGPLAAVVAWVKKN